MLLGQATGWLRSAPLTFRGAPLYEMERPVYAALLLLFFTATLFLTAAMVSRM